MAILPDYIQNSIDWASMRGWRIFPTNPDQKTPCIKDPFGRATNDPDEIIKLFSDFPGAGMGVPTGPSNGITVIDIDRKNGVDGLLNFQALNIHIPQTAIVHTPSNGFHIYFHTEDLEIPNSVSGFVDGVDVRGVGGYVQGPGTVTSTGRYSWDDGYISPLGKLGKMPTELIKLCMGARVEEVYSLSWKKSQAGEQLLDPIFEGNRNNTMASRIGYLIKKLDPIVALDAAIHINKTCCKPPLEDRELFRIFHSILRREVRNV